MKRILTIVLAFFIVATVAGCDRASETHTKTETDSQGNVIKQDHSSTTVDNAGNVHQTESHTDNR